MLFSELQIFNNPEIFAELESYITQLLDIAEKSRSYTLLAETYYLKAKLALLTFDVKKAERFLTQAQRIAERWGYNQIATRISIEHDKLRNQTKLWEDLKEKDVSISERMKLAEISEQMRSLINKSPSLTTQIKEEKVTIHRAQKICVVCKGDVLGFMYTCSCDTIYCEKCARALTDLENQCWVCDTPIDTSKPMKPYKEEEGREEVKKKT